MWLQITLHLSNEGEDFQFKSDFEVKLDCNMNGKQLKRVLQKLCIKIWNRLNNDNKIDHDEVDLDQTIVSGI